MGFIGTGYASHGYSNTMHLEDVINPYDEKERDMSLVSSRTTEWRAYIVAWVMAKIGGRTTFVWRAMDGGMWIREEVFWGTD